ncbi:MAG: cadherin-like domain-containing protein [Planctomycetales bacterium]|nr:cadherin-like domain-containing protein [Planctomycetales bacterium]
MLGAIETNLSLSFAPDGTEIAGEPSVASATFGNLGTTAQWQTAVVQAFQTWGTQTEANIGVTSDSGDPFGVPGESTHDDRFGDIRIGARPLENGVAAISLPLTSLASGTWLGEVIFNSDYPFSSVDDVFAVALHEAANVFGLPDSDDPGSPRFPGDIPTVTWPTPQDIEDIQALHGERVADRHERVGDGEFTDNDSFDHATTFEFPDHMNIQGAAPIILYGDLTQPGDEDFFRFELPGDATGSLTVQLRTAGFSSLVGQLEIYNEAQVLIGSTAAQSPLDQGALVLQVPAVTADQKYFVRVSGNATDVSGVGAYSLVATLDSLNLIDAAEIDQLSDGRFARLHPEELLKLYTSEDEFISRDSNSDDDFQSATELSFGDAFGGGVRLERYGSISQSTDVDVYKVQTPNDPALSVLHVTVESLEIGGLIPQIQIVDSEHDLLPTQTLVGGGGITTLQVTGLSEDSEYFVRIAADSAYFSTGNYRLKAVLQSTSTDMEQLLAGELDDSVNHQDRPFYVARPQLFHFAVTAPSNGSTEPEIAQFSLKDEGGLTVTSLGVRPGESRTASSVFLLPGTYSIEMDAWTLSAGPLSAPLTYTLHGVTVSDPLAIDFNGTIDQPFNCEPPNGATAFCYPDGTQSNKTYVVDPTTNPGTVTQTLPQDELTRLIYGDWWSWVWTSGAAGNPPTATDETFQLTVDQSVATFSADGVLANDADPEGAPLLAILQTAPEHGTLDFAADGSFTYTPDAGYVGEDHFTYQAFDLGSLSSPATVTLQVFARGDMNYDGSLDASDIDQLAMAIRTTESAAVYDLNGDESIDWADYSYLIVNLLATSPGDANLDGVVNGVDLEAWQSNRFTTEGGWATGDFNGDTVIDGADFNVWIQNRFMTSANGSSGGDLRIPRAPLASAMTTHPSIVIPPSSSFIVTRDSTRDMSPQAVSSSDEAWQSVDDMAASKSMRNRLTTSRRSADQVGRVAERSKVDGRGNTAVETETDLVLALWATE